MVSVTAWLLRLGLGKYEQAFRNNDIDASLLPTLTDDDLRELGVVSLGHRKQKSPPSQNLTDRPTRRRWSHQPFLKQSGDSLPSCSLIWLVRRLYHRVAILRICVRSCTHNKML
ncbi:SAM domain-containing protein [Sinorhizobium numidicum]|uniref:SAM domain-containing protein n=1 Tax=Sinorhizobium numidicum TaxID=680248 RepID=UPI003CC8A4F3